jgi:RNA polymerase-binding transcription factor DksA
MISFELECRGCGWRTVSGRDDAVSRLRTIGLLRRNPEADDELVSELMLESVSRMACPACKERQLAARVQDAANVADDLEWQTAVLCEICREPIALERLEAIPGAKRCAACQGKAETGLLAEVEPEYCPHCGALVEIRVSRGGGITRYKRVCTGVPPCRL